MVIKNIIGLSTKRFRMLNDYDRVSIPERKSYEHYPQYLTERMLLSDLTEAGESKLSYQITGLRRESAAWCEPQ